MEIIYYKINNYKLLKKFYSYINYKISILNKNDFILDGIKNDYWI